VSAGDREAALSINASTAIAKHMFRRVFTGAKGWVVADEVFSRFPKKWREPMNLCGFGFGPTSSG
jgi:hypothetical protein